MILSLETSTRVCSVALHDQGKCIAEQAYHLQKSHSELLPVIVDQLLKNSGTESSSVKAVAVSAGPGSYTGLRIGTSCAKGLAFSWEIPLIAIDSLDILLQPLKQWVTEEAILMPMLDARRNEVYTCAFNTASACRIWETRPLVLTGDSLDAFKNQKVIVFGDGAHKSLELVRHRSLQLVRNQYPSAGNMGPIAWELYQQNSVVDIAYFEPEYLKPYHTNKPKKLIF